MGRAVPLGHHFEGLGPIPPRPEHTRWFPVGPLTIGVEHRSLDAEVLGEAFQDERRATLDAAVADSHGDGVVEDGGVSLHVCDGDTGVEYLRFDCFEGDPHYHYIQGGTYSITVPHDEDANGDALTWALGRLESRLPAMLRVAEAEHLAAALSDEALAAGLPAVRATARQAAEAAGVAGDATDRPVP